jgi:DnaK suppressor protein
MVALLPKETVGYFMSKKKTRYDDQEPLTAKQLAHFREILDERRKKILQEVDSDLEDIREGNTDVRASDEVDQAGIDYDKSLERRMRDREKGLLKKLLKVLRRMDSGEYDECESCSAYIGYKRLSARPEATMCIECKEEQEHVESHFKDSREPETPFPFK